MLGLNRVLDSGHTHVHWCGGLAGVIFTILMLIGKLMTDIRLICIAVSPSTIVTKIKTFASHAVALQWSCLSLATSAERSRSGARNRANDSVSKMMPNVSITLVVDAVQAPTRSSDRRSQEYL